MALGGRRVRVSHWCAEPILRLALKLSLPLARQHFINQPVVVEAGLKLWHHGRKSADLVPVDVTRLYGEESWMRAPIEALHLRASPDGRYAAALYGRERAEGWATLFFWDVRERRILRRIGTEPGRMLDTISAGFRFIYPPAQLSADWQYLLVSRQDGSLEVFRSVR